MRSVVVGVAVVGVRPGAADVDRHLVTRLDRTRHLDELTGRRPQPVDLGGHLVVGHLERRERHHQTAVAGDGHDGADQDDGLEGDRTGLLARRDVDVGLVDRVDLRLVDGPRVELGQRLPDGLTPQRGGAAHARLEDLPRHLSGPEPGNPDLTRQTLHHVVEGFVDLGFVDLDGETDLVALLGRCCCSHTNRGVYRYPGLDFPARRAASDRVGARAWAASGGPADRAITRSGHERHRPRTR